MQSSAIDRHSFHTNKDLQRLAVKTMNLLTLPAEQMERNRGGVSRGGSSIRLFQGVFNNAADHLRETSIIISTSGRPGF